MYKLVAIDLDGTLLNSYGEISDYTKQVLKEKREQGIEIVLASGRTIDSIKNIAEEISSSRYIIAGNGAIIYDIKNNSIIYENCLPKYKALDIINICENNSITYNVYTDKTIVANALKYNVLYYHKGNIKKDESKKTSIKIVENIYDYVKNMQDEQVMKISICDEDQSVFNGVLKTFNAFDDIDVLEVSHNSKKIIKYGSEEVLLAYYYTEISKKNVNKWSALEFLINSLNINKNEVIAVGDNVNDKMMIENAGLGIAMKDSTPAITEFSDYITEYGNNDDGVAKALLHYI